MMNILPSSLAVQFNIIRFPDSSGLPEQHETPMKSIVKGESSNLTVMCTLVFGFIKIGLRMGFILLPFFFYLSRGTCERQLGAF